MQGRHRHSNKVPCTDWLGLLIWYLFSSPYPFVHTVGSGAHLLLLLLLPPHPVLTKNGRSEVLQLQGFLMLLVLMLLSSATVLVLASVDGSLYRKEQCEISKLMKRKMTKINTSMLASSKVPTRLVTSSWFCCCC